MVNRPLVANNIQLVYINDIIPYLLVTREMYIVYKLYFTWGHFSKYIYLTYVLSYKKAAVINTTSSAKLKKRRA